MNTSLIRKTAVGKSDDEQHKVYRSVYLNSSDRTYGTNNNPIYQLDPEIEESYKLKLLSVNLPLSFYNFNNATLTVVESPGTPYTITLNGNYNIIQLVLAIQSTFNGLSVNKYIVSWNKNTNKITLLRDTNISSVGFYVSTTGTANFQLGFQNPSQSFLTSQTSDSCVILQRQYVKIRSNELTSSVATNSRSYFNNISNSNVVSVIPIISGYGQYHYFELPSAIEYLSSNTENIEYLSFYIEDEDDNQLDLQGIPFQIKLGVVS